MNLLSLIRKAELSDRSGNYKLADKYFSRAKRLAGLSNPLEEAVVKALEKGIEESLIKSLVEDVSLSLEAKIEKLVAQGLEKEAAEFLLKAEAAERNLLFEAAKLDVPIKDVPIIDPPKKGFDKFKEISKEKFTQISDALENLSRSKGKKFLITTAVITALTTLGYFVVGGKLFRPNGTEADETDIEKVDPYKNMYEDRMKAGQQQRQNEAAQSFVEENKSNIKTQREFYNAALQKGDKNFANDVIAIVKRDMPELQIEIK